MEIYLTISRIGSLFVWVVFWLAILIIFLFKKDAFFNFFNGIKKILSAVIGLSIFFIVFNFLLWSDEWATIDRLADKWAYVLIFTGYFLVLIGFISAIVVIVEISSSARTNIIDIDRFKHIRNLSYLSFFFIAIGFSLATVNVILLGMSIIVLIPLLMYRIKIENKANSDYILSK